MKRLIALTGVVVAAALVSEIAAAIPRGPVAPPSGGFPLIFYLEVGIVLLGGASALAFLLWQPSNAPGMFGVGLYTLIMGLVFFTIFPVWLSGEWLLDGALVLAAVLAALGLALLLTSGAILIGGPRPRALALGLAGGPSLLALGWVAAFVGAREGVRHIALSPTILVAALALLVLGGLLALLGRQRGGVILPVILACGGAVFTIALLLARGPSDWASGAPSLHLYSFPIAVIGKAISLAIMHVTQRASTAPSTSPSGSPSTPTGTWPVPGRGRRARGLGR